MGDVDLPKTLPKDKASKKTVKVVEQDESADQTFGAYEDSRVVAEDYLTSIGVFNERYRE